jgi:hypothetical protein
MDESKTPPTQSGIVPLSNSVPRGFGFVHHSIAILDHEVPNPNLTIRHFCIAVARTCTSSTLSKSPNCVRNARMQRRPPAGSSSVSCCVCPVTMFTTVCPRSAVNSALGSAEAAAAAAEAAALTSLLPRGVRSAAVRGGWSEPRCTACTRPTHALLGVVLWDASSAVPLSVGRTEGWVGGGLCCSG